jgi:DNA-binding MarR family transcriptional regulator
MIFKCYDIWTMTQNESSKARGAASPAFLLAQVGAHAAAKFAERLGPLGLTPAHVGSMRIITASPGSSQQQVAERLGMFPSRFVALVDELQDRGLVERRENANDRRTYILHVTQQGKDVLQSVGKVARDHQEALLAALTKDERDLLASLLLRVADQQGLRPGVHPGFARLRPEGAKSAKSPDESKSER